MALIECVFNHLVLPPKVPGAHDQRYDEVSRDLVERLLDSVASIAKHVPPSQRQALATLSKSLVVYDKLNRGYLDKLSLVKAFATIEEQPLILYMEPQNAALIMRLEHDTSNRPQSVIFEAFEASPHTAAVLAAEGALLWDFPGTAAAVPFSHFLDAKFQEGLAEFLEGASMETLSHFSAKIFKAGDTSSETRDTASPGLLTECLLPLLEEIGSAAQVPLLRKRVRDNVNIDNAERPWRRHPHWLVLRVAVQRQLRLTLGDLEGRTVYKFVIVTTLVRLLKQCPSRISAEMTLLLKRKICRRLAKLEMEATQQGDNNTCQMLLQTVGPLAILVIDSVSDEIQTTWANFKRQKTRKVVRLSPAQCRPSAQDFVLSLPCSGGFLNDLLHLHSPKMLQDSPSDILDITDEGIKMVQKFTAQYRKLAKLEDTLKHALDRFEADIDALERHQLISGCQKLARNISMYFEQASEAYKSDPLQTSAFLLHIFDLWRLLDMYCCRALPLLLDHHPIFTAELLDGLQLPDPQDLRRLYVIQDYLRRRVSGSSFPDILSHCNSEKHFPYRAFRSDLEMPDVEAEILHDSEARRTQKKQEWESQLSEWERLTDITRQIEVCSCPYGSGNRFSQRDVESRTVCMRCRAFRSRSALSIRVHEDYLPTSKPFRRAAIVFELEMPDFLALYRETTWLIVRDLAHPTWPQLPAKKEPPLLLDGFKPLHPYGSRSLDGDLTLASAKKSWLQTHYNNLPVSRATDEFVIHGFAPDLCLYDASRKIWAEHFDRDALTLEHLCGIHLPSALEKAIPRIPHPPITVIGPSSYQLLANQTLCPRDVSLHEFSVFQKLLLGSSQRWMNILVELGSANLNFSSAETVKMLVQLAVRAGPHSGGAYLPREAFRVFDDAAFCDQLAKQIHNRLDTIRCNWRESNCMRLLIVLSECLIDFGRSSAGKELIKSTREITLGWIRRLREESISSGTDTTNTSAFALYSFAAAILCRRTFARETSPLSGTDLSIYGEASIALHQNTPPSLVQDPEIKAMMIHDTKSANRLDHLISGSLRENPHALDNAVTQAWPSMSYKFSPWAMDPSAHGWAVAKMGIQGSKFENVHTVHFNYLDGFLLLDSKPVGGLPMKIRLSPVVQRLFGNAPLRTIASKRSGMPYRLVNSYKGNEVHFGIRHGGTSSEAVVIQLTSSWGTVEFVPREVFSTDRAFDLPMKLRDESCVHFIDYATGRLEVRPLSRFWNSKPQDWVIDLRTRTGHRRKNGGIYRLLNQESGIGRSFVQSFEHFERPEGLLAYMTPRGRLQVEVNRFELTFFVNPKGLLQDNKSNMEFDEDQDAGTFHGLLSKIVLRDVKDPSKRSIMVPLSDPEYRLCGPHMEIVMRRFDTVTVGKFDINRVLGRLETPPEPALIFAKAYLHALTSFPIPDRLTNRTGMEEAFHILRAGASQPWQPFGKMPLKYLAQIAQLSPKRVFYPEDQQRLQSTHWVPTLLVTVQHDHLSTLVQNLVDKSQKLQVFGRNQETDEPRIPRHILRRRGEHERTLYEPQTLHPTSHSVRDKFYCSRDNRSYAAESSRGAHNVATVTRSLFDRPFLLPGRIDLKAILLQQEVIGGFEAEGTFACSLSKLFDGEVFGQWGQLVQHSIDADPERPYGLAFHLALLAFHGVHDIYRVLAAFARVDVLKGLPIPYHPEFTGLETGKPDIDKFTNLIKQLSPDFVPSQKCKLIAAARQRHENRCEAESRLLAGHFIEQWPARRPSLQDSAPETELIDPEEVLEAVSEIWEKLIRNRELGLFVEKVQGVLDWSVTVNPRPFGFMAPSSAPSHDGRPRPSNILCFGSALRNAPPLPDLATDLLPKEALHYNQSKLIPSPQQLVRQRSLPTSIPIWSTQLPSDHFKELRHLLKDFSGSTDPLRQAYGKDLLESLAALEKAGGATTKSWELKETARSEFGLQQLTFQAETLINDQRNQIIDDLARGDNRYEWLRLGDLWPATGPVTLLEQLRSNSRIDFGAGIKESLVRYGLLITLRQWLGRVQHEMLHGNVRKMGELLKNTGHENWNPVDKPDWLLMEIEADLLIRPRQVDVANQIISPKSHRNSLTQLMMGEGKTSCIVPMAIAMLADGSQITRLIVPKALLFATGQTLQSRIGGLVGRRVCHIPFSRRTPSNQTVLDLYSQLHEETLREGGVLLTTTDHILSFKLSGLQKLTDEKFDLAKRMISFQRYLDKICRDIVDESDLTLGVKTQLIYPSGPQVRVDGAPQRWEVAESLLHLVEQYLPDIQARFPDGLEITRLQTADGFPMAHFLSEDAEDELHRLLIDDICNGRTPFLRPARPDEAETNLHQCIRRLLEGDSNKVLRQSGTTPKESLEIFADKDSAPKILLLIRGLLMNRILLLCLKKRWSVQYGLHPNRDPLAVPFEAKGVPSEQAEFGHPEVSIVLTILSFYFAGLTRSDFQRSLKRVLESDDPASEYERFTHNCQSLPNRLRYYYVINIDDNGQVEELYSHLKSDRNVLNYHLNTFVFPVHAKQFARKLSSSSWDIPQMNTDRNAASKAITTGFSGTNDNKSLLPLNIRQDDLPSLQHTNAEVLGYLLQKRNRQYHLAVDKRGRLTEEALLSRLKAMKIRVLIDAGAYILEMTNKDLAKAWLRHDTSAKAAVFFDQGRAWVISRNAKQPQPLVASPWRDEITGEVLVFFDEANCRGIDLKLAPDAKAALTLALNQTKDHTVQAAMRLRQLATTQSVAFIAPPEVHVSLVDVCGLAQYTLVNSTHVLKWLLEQTCRTNESLQNLHLAQGIEFCRRKDAQLTYPRATDDATERMLYLNVLMQEERQDLEQLYGPVTDRSIRGSPDEVYHPGLKRYMTFLAQKRKSTGKHPKGQRIHSSALEEVEQEREVAYEVQEIRQPEKPVVYEALTFSRLHPAVDRFARTGILQGPNGYMHVFESLQNTMIGKKFEIRGTGSRLYCSVEFSRSVDLVVGAKTADNFLRPVEWILWSPSSETALLIIPEEAELLIPVLRLAGPTAHTYLLTYAAPVTKSMADFNSFRYFTIPSLPKHCEFPQWFRIELGLFAGQLYASFDDCLETAEYLKAMGRHDDANAVPNSESSADGGAVSKFSANPIGFLLEWLALRRQVQDILQTPMGYICKGSKLHPEHPFFKTPAMDEPGPVAGQPSTSTSADASDESDDDDVDDEDDDEYVGDDSSETSVDHDDP